MKGRLLAALVALGFTTPAVADDVGSEVRVAVAANALAAVTEIAAAFEAETGHLVQLSAGATGQLYAQIVHGAPFDVFLAADQDRPARAEAEGLAVPASRFTYAIGRLVLVAAEPQTAVDEGTLAAPFGRLAIANPRTAPYGVAAVEALTALGVYEAAQPRLVFGNNVAQAYQFVASGNADLGLVAGSLVIEHHDGPVWPVPDHLHAPIAQDAVLLTTAAENAAAGEFLAFLRGPEAEAILNQFGYLGGDRDAHGDQP